jgi:endonuclease/exonuclease/phosphatase family metal-dependent hydrolase
MKIVSWNCKGAHQTPVVFKENIDSIVGDLEPDVLCVQEYPNINQDGFQTIPKVGNIILTKKPAIQKQRIVGRYPVAEYNGYTIVSVWAWENKPNYLSETERFFEKNSSQFNENTIIIGDFNITKPEELEQLAKKYDLVVLNYEKSLKKEYYADYCIVSKNLENCELKYLDYYGSDHRAMTLEIKGE